MANELVDKLIREVEKLEIPGLQLNGLYLMMGEDINFEYPMPNGTKIKILNDFSEYLTSRVKLNDKLYELVANEKMMLVYVIEKNGSQEIIFFKKIQ